MTLPTGTSRPWEPLGGRTDDGAFNAMQLEIDAACDALYAVAQKGAVWTCRHCHGHVPEQGEWWSRQLLSEAADAHYQAGRGTKYEGLSSSIWFLAINRLVDQGVFVGELFKGVRLAEGK